VAKGHFGLEGIQERVDRLDGEVDISSSPGRGTKVTVAFDIPPAKMEEGQGNG
jgi:signal transduction histidine kinase